MQRFLHLLMPAAILAAFLCASSVTQASDYHDCRPHYKWVTVYQTVKVPVYSYVTKYHACGTPYRVRVVTYRHTKVAVQKRVRITY